MPVILTDTASITDSGDLRLVGPVSVATAVIGADTYLFVGGGTDSGVSAFRVGADGSLANVANVAGPVGVSSLAVVASGSQTLLYVTGFVEQSVGGFIVGGDGSLTPIGPATALGFRPTTITPVVAGGQTYFFVASPDDDSVRALKLGVGGALTPLQSNADQGLWELDGVRSVCSAVIDGVPYLFAAGQDDDGISVFSVASDGTLTNRANVTDDATLELDGASSLTTAVVGGTTFLFVAGVDDDGISVFRVGANGSLQNVDNVTDSESEDLRLDVAAALTTATIGGRTFLFAAGQADDGVSVFAVGADGSLTHVANVVDQGVRELDGPNALGTAVVGGATYLFATGYFDDGISAFLVQSIVAVDDADAAPDGVAENAAVGTSVGLTAHATALEGAIAYSLTDDAGGRFAIDPITGVVTVANGALLDFEAATSHDVTVKATDNYGLSSEQTFLIEISDAPGIRIHANSSGGLLSGTSEADKLIGSIGRDIFTGGEGADSFVFRAKLNTKTKVDKITDFSHTDDTILLEDRMFRKLDRGPLPPSEFFRGDKAHDRNDYIVYNRKTGVLYYDEDGSGRHRPIKFAVLEGSPDDVTASDFLVI